MRISATVTNRTMDRREPEASSGEIWHWLAAGESPGIFKFVVCEDSILLLSGKVTAMPGISSCISWTGALDMT